MQDIYIFGQKSQKREIKNIELTIIININPPPSQKDYSSSDFSLKLIRLQLSDNKGSIYRNHKQDTSHELVCIYKTYGGLFKEYVGKKILKIMASCKKNNPWSLPPKFWHI